MKNNDTCVELVNITYLLGVTWDVIKEMNTEAAKNKSKDMKL